MAGHNWNKVTCGAELDPAAWKRCACGHQVHPGTACVQCGKVAALWCEAPALHGQRCKAHAGRPVHPGAGELVRQLRVKVLMRPETLSWVDALAQLPPAERARELSLLAAGRAFEGAADGNGDPRAFVWAVRSLEAEMRIALAQLGLPVDEEGKPRKLDASRLNDEELRTFRALCVKMGAPGEDAAGETHD